MGGNIYCIFCGGPLTDKVLGPGGIIAPVRELDTSHIRTSADSLFLQRVHAISASLTTDIAAFFPETRTVRIFNSAWMIRNRLMGWQVDSENPDDGQSWWMDSDGDSVVEVVEGETDEEDDDDPYGEEDFDVDPALPYGGSLAHMNCLRLYLALSDQVFSKTSHEPPTYYKTLWDSEGRPCVPYMYSGEHEIPMQKETLDLESGRGRVSGITSGTEEQCQQDFVFVPEKLWMLARPDRFPAVPLWKAQPKPTSPVRRQSELERLPVEILTLLVQTIVNGPDHPVSKGKTLLAMAGTSPWLRQHVTTLNLWPQICAQAELLPYTELRTSAKAVAEAINLSKAQPHQLKYDWMAYVVRASQYPPLRNRQRIIRICEEIWDRLGFYRKRI